MNPVDEDDGKLILPGSVKDDLNCLTEVSFWRYSLCSMYYCKTHISMR